MLHSTSGTMHSFGGKKRLATAKLLPISVIQTILTAAEHEQQRLKSASLLKDIQMHSTSSQTQ